MKKLIHQLGEYLEGALSISIEPRPWEKSSELPQYAIRLVKTAKCDGLPLSARWITEQIA